LSKVKYIVEFICRESEPSAFLPIQMPADKTAIEKQAEDVSFDIVMYKDSAGNS